MPPVSAPQRQPGGQLNNKENLQKPWKHERYLLYPADSFASQHIPSSTNSRTLQSRNIPLVSVLLTKHTDRIPQKQKQRDESRLRSENVDVREDTALSEGF